MPTDARYVVRKCLLDNGNISTYHLMTEDPSLTNPRYVLLGHGVVYSRDGVVEREPRTLVGWFWRRREEQDARLASD